MSAISCTEQTTQLSHLPLSSPKQEQKTYPLYFAPDTPLFARILCQGVSEFRGNSGMSAVGRDITIKLPHEKDGKTTTSPIVDMDRLFHESNWQRVLDFIFTSRSQLVRILLAKLKPFQQLQFIRLSADEGRALLLKTMRPVDIHSIGMLANRCDKDGRILVPVLEVKPKTLRVVTTKEVFNGEHTVKLMPTEEEIVFQLLFKNKAGPVKDEE